MACPCEKLFAQKLPDFKYPDGLDKKMQKAFKEQFKQGYSLFLSNCASCHGPNDSIQTLPQFTDTQFFNYQLRSSTEHIFTFRDIHLRDEDFTRILLFLQYLEATPTK
jgi:cytochrome c peroxidase